MSANVNDWLEDLRGTLKDQLPCSRITTIPRSRHRAIDPEDEDTRSGVAYNWSAFNFTYGDHTTSASSSDDDS